MYQKIIIIDKNELIAALINVTKQNYHTIYNKQGHFKKEFELYGEDYIAAEAKIHELGSILSTPAIEEKVIYFGSSDGYFYALKLE